MNYPQLSIIFININVIYTFNISSKYNKKLTVNSLEISGGTNNIDRSLSFVNSTALPNPDTENIEFRLFFYVRCLLTE